MCCLHFLMPCAIKTNPWLDKIFGLPKEPKSVCSIISSSDMEYVLKTSSEIWSKFNSTDSERNFLEKLLTEVKY